MPDRPGRRSGSARFVLQFPIQEVPALAARYAYEDDAEVLAIGRAARERGYYKLEEFIAICRWKTPRSGPLVRQNSAETVEIATRRALAGSTSERARME